jgi:hypothetical protein
MVVWCHSGAMDYSGVVFEYVSVVLGMLILRPQ